MMNSDAGWPERRGLDSSRPAIDSLTGNVLGRVVRRTLKLGTQETDQGVADVALGERANIRRGRDDTAGQIVSVGLYAEPGGGEIGFGLFLNEASESGCGTQKHHQESGGKGIEGPGVPCTSNSQHSPHPMNDVVRGHASCLVDQDRTDQVSSSRRMEFSNSLMRTACSSPRSSSKCSSGTVRVVSARAARDRRKPAALCSPSSARVFSASSPGTLTMTRAWERSLLTSTAVTVTKPTRGSRTSRDRLSVMTCRSVSAICSGRREEPLIGRP